MAKNVTITKKEEIILKRLLNTFIDSDHFSGEHMPKEFKDEKEVNATMSKLLKKL